MLLVSSADFLKKNNFFKIFFHEHNQHVKQFGSRPGPTYCLAVSGSKLFTKVISRRQMSWLKISKKKVRGGLKVEFLVKLSY